MRMPTVVRNMRAGGQETSQARYGEEAVVEDVLMPSLMWVLKIHTGMAWRARMMYTEVDQ